MNDHKLYLYLDSYMDYEQNYIIVVISDLIFLDVYVEYMTEILTIETDTLTINVE